MLSKLEPESAYITFNLNLTFELAPLHHLESAVLSKLEPESAYITFNLNLNFQL